MQTLRSLTARALFLASLSLCAALPALAQPASYSLTMPSTALQIKPQAAPTGSAVAVTTVDAYLMTLTLTNTTSGALTVIVADRQGTPVQVIPTVSVPANTVYVVAFPSLYWCPSGFTILASGTGINYYASWRQ